MLKLLLLRHAKSSWDDAQLADRDRPLNERGIEAASRMGRFLRDNDLLPDRVLVSPARRTQDTWSLVHDELGTAIKAKVVDALYDFGSGGALLDVIRSEGGDAPRLMLVGHNPATERLAARLAGDGETDQLAEMRRKFPTAALAVIAFEAAEWSRTGWGEGRLEAFVRPRQLQDGA